MLGLSPDKAPPAALASHCDPYYPIVRDNQPEMGRGKAWTCLESDKSYVDLVLRQRIADRPPGAEITLRRFWKTVHIKEEEDGLLITLDHRNLKTPSGTKLVLPKDRRLLALLIANEWENQDEILKQHALPLVSSS